MGFGLNYCPCASQPVRKGTTEKVAPFPGLSLLYCFGPSVLILIIWLQQELMRKRGLPASKAAISPQIQRIQTGHRDSCTPKHELCKQEENIIWN